MNHEETGEGLQTLDKSINTPENRHAVVRGGAHAYAVVGDIISSSNSRSVNQETPWGSPQSWPACRDRLTSPNGAQSTQIMHYPGVHVVELDLIVE